MNKDKILKNAALAGADLSSFSSIKYSKKPMYSTQEKVQKRFVSVRFVQNICIFFSNSFNRSFSSEIAVENCCFPIFL